MKLTKDYLISKFKDYCNNSIYDKERRDVLEYNLNKNKFSLKETPIGCIEIQKSYYEDDKFGSFDCIRLFEYRDSVSHPVYGRNYKRPFECKISQKEYIELEALYKK